MLSWYAQRNYQSVNTHPTCRVFIKYVPLTNCSKILGKVCSFGQLRPKHPLPLGCVYMELSVQPFKLNQLVYIEIVSSNFRYYHSIWIYSDLQCLKGICLGTIQTYFILLLRENISGVNNDFLEWV